MYLTMIIHAEIHEHPWLAVPKDNMLKYIRDEHSYMEDPLVFQYDELNLHGVKHFYISIICTYHLTKVYMTWPW